MLLLRGVIALVATLSGRILISCTYIILLVEKGRFSYIDQIWFAENFSEFDAAE
jgi:hypothetical protein